MSLIVNHSAERII